MLGVINEEATAQYSCQLQDEQSVGIPVDQLLTATMTYYDRQTGGVINNREDQDILNANGVTIDSEGNLVWNITVEDTIIINAIRVDEIETHLALITYTWSVSGVPKTHRHLVEFGVKQLLKVT